MDAKSLTKLLDSLSYRPGWEFSASEQQDGNVHFQMSCNTVDTDRDCARAGYRTPKRLDWDFVLEPGDWTQDDILRQTFGMLMDIELHESREFFRVKSADYAAPFHPHRPEGEAAWAGGEIALPVKAAH